ncbi:uncharacterized protein FA14DRAFT_28366 [Meira miltonrushii]|uniref:triacylglycerol lipase n=1 Tax=Meira miltonrushii TaxID=1280837 RepID=A0A316VLZ5_9BASI|nr:uncharacterized protein FA14DRAFT_28366 [Meira miltonrushii]PWN38612.1 hypothetical protein FA14DRAFT_28366 [Meira miltonrushii]
MRFFTIIILFFIFALATVASDTCGTNAHADPFFEAPNDVAEYSLGKIIRSREVQLNVTALPMLQAVGKTYQIVYRSQGFDASQPEANVMTVFVPKTYNPSKVSNVEVVLGAAAYDSNNPQCGPSRTILSSNVTAELFSVGIQLSLNRIYVLPDFEGPKAAFQQGNVAAAACLDALRALLQFSTIIPSTSKDKVRIGLEGYSNGGHAIAWTLQRLYTYAPELEKHVVGASIGGVPANATQVAQLEDGTRIAGFILLSLFGQAKVDKRVESWIEKHGIAGQIKKAKQYTETLCIDTVLKPFAGQKIWEKYFNLQAVQAYDDSSLPLSEGVVATQQGQSYAVKEITVPIFLFHSIHDQFVPIMTADEYQSRLCSGKSATVRYIRSTTEKHLGMRIVHIPYTALFLQGQFSGKGIPTGCQREDKALTLDDPTNVAAFGNATITALTQALQLARSEE